MEGICTTMHVFTIAIHALPPAHLKSWWAGALVGLRHFQASSSPPSSNAHYRRRPLVVLGLADWDTSSDDSSSIDACSDSSLLPATSRPAWHQRFAQAPRPMHWHQQGGATPEVVSLKVTPATSSSFGAWKTVQTGTAQLPSCMSIIDYVHVNV